MADDGGSNAMDAVAPGGDSTANEWVGLLRCLDEGLDGLLEEASPGGRPSSEGGGAGGGGAPSMRPLRDSSGAG